MFHLINYCILAAV